MKNQNYLLDEIGRQSEDKDHQFACLSTEHLENLKKIRLEGNIILSGLQMSNIANKYMNHMQRIALSLPNTHTIFELTPV
jgi:hypothetical protein